MTMALQDPVADIRLLINSPGGSVPGMLAIRDRGAIPDLVLEADEIERVRRMLEQNLATHTGKAQEQMHEDTERHLILTATGALEYGVVDAVLTARDPVSP